MNKEFLQKAQEVIESGDEQAKKELMSSEEYKQFKKELLSVCNSITNAVSVICNHYMTVFKSIFPVYKEEKKHLVYVSYKKNKSQRKNWRKWKKH